MRKAFFVLLCFLIFIGCAKSQEKQTQEKQKNTESRSVVETVKNERNFDEMRKDKNLTREIAKRIIQNTNPSELVIFKGGYSSNGVEVINAAHTFSVYGYVGERLKDCYTKFLEELKSNNIIVDFSAGTMFTHPGFFVRDIVFSSEARKYILVVGKGRTDKGACIGDIYYVIFDSLLVEITGIRKNNDSVAVVQVTFKPNKLFEIQGKYKCAQIATYEKSSLSMTYKFVYYDDGWRIEEIGG